MNSEKSENGSSVNSFRNISIADFARSNKYPLIVTLGFFLIISYVTFFHHHYWWENDGIYFLNVGKQILNGNGWNVKILDAPPGGPVLFAALDSVFHDGFVIVKIISLLSGTGIVLVSYYIIRNIFNSKIALLGQLFFAFNPRFDFLTTLSLNELLPVLLISVSLYFITKKNLKLSDTIIVGLLLGISFMIRYQAAPVLIALLIFLLIHNRKIRINLSHVAIMCAFFLIASSPLYIYNYSTHSVILDSNPNFFLLVISKYQTPEWHQQMENLVATDSNSSGFFLDFSLFLKNYFYNLFYHNPSNLFNFNKLENISIIPPIPFLGFLPVVGGLIYCLKMKLNKTNLLIMLGTSLITALFVFLLGDITVHFFAIVMIPLLALGIMNIRNIEKNFLPLLVLSVIFFVIMSTVLLYRPYQLLPMWTIIPALSAVFFIEVIPKICYKIKTTIAINKAQKISLLLIFLILLVNLGFSYRLIEGTFYNDPYTDIKSEFFKIFQKHEPKLESAFEIKQIGEILSKQPGIEDSYVMANELSYTYYANSKYVHTYFTEGIKNDTMDTFLTRENWTDYDLLVSNLLSNPIDRNDIYKPMPDYFIYKPPPVNPNPIWYVKTRNDAVETLSDPNDPKILPNFEILYKSNVTGVVVYKINHNKD